MVLYLIIALMIGIISFVVFFALYLEFRREGIIKPTSELKKKIINVLLATNFGIGGTIIFIIIALGLSPVKENDVSGWVTLAVSIGIGIGVAVSIGIYTTNSQKKTEDLTKEIHEYIGQQKNKEKMIQADYARNLIFFINWSRMKVHGMNVQIKLLKQILQRPFSTQRIVDEQTRREIFERYVIELQDLMSQNKITPDMILEIFDDKTQLLFLTMWKMFGSASSVLHVGENDYKSLMTLFVGKGVESSEKLYNILIEYLPENERNGSSLQSVETS